MPILRIEEALRDYHRDGVRNFYAPYALLKSRLLDNEYQHTSAEFPGGNDHGPGHIYRLLEKLDEILGPEPLRHLNVFELWIAMAAGLYHDVGLLQSRDGHPQIGADLMLGEQNTYIVDRFERKLAHTAIATHGSRADIDDQCKAYPRQLKIGPFTVDARRMCALVRLADELDEDHRRGDLEIYKKREIAKKYPESVPYWRFNQCIPGVQIDAPAKRREIQFQFQFEPEDLDLLVKQKDKASGQPLGFPEFVVEKLLKINKERVLCNAYLPEELRFSHLILLLLPVRGLSWDIPKEIQFEDRCRAEDIWDQLPKDLKPKPAPVSLAFPFPQPAPNARPTFSPSAEREALEVLPLAAQPQVQPLATLVAAPAVGSVAEREGMEPEPTAVTRIKKKLHRRSPEPRQAACNLADRRCTRTPPHRFSLLDAGAAAAQRNSSRRTQVLPCRDDVATDCLADLRVGPRQGRVPGVVLWRCHVGGRQGDRGHPRPLRRLS